MKYANILVVCLFFLNNSIQLYAKQLQVKTTSAPMTSISDDALFSLTHYYKFYSDANTIYGNFFKRSYALGSISGLRDRLADHGIYADTSVDLFYGFNTTGGADKDFLRHNGLAEYWLVLDTAKNNLWPNGTFMLNAYTSWEFSVNEDVGSLVTANASAIRPTKGRSITVFSELVFEQVINKHCTVRIGKLDAIGPLDDNNFANTSRYQFLNTGLVNNPIILTFVPYTQLGMFGIFTATDLHTVKLFIGDINSNANKSKLKTLFAGKNTYCFQYQCTPNFNHTLPGNYRAIICVSNQEITDYSINTFILSGQNIATIPINPQTINYALLLNFDQYLWIDRSVDNNEINLRGQPPIGFGIFGRAGWAPQDRNGINQFYSIGIGGYGLPCTKRYYDFWGIGYTATGISSNLRRDLQKQNMTFRSFEQAFEAFYNLELGPSVHLLFDAQIIKPPLQTRNTAFVLQTRFRIDF